MYIKNINTQITIFTEKSLVDLFSLQIHQLVHHAMWVDSVVSSESPFQLIHKSVLRAVLESWISQKRFYMIQTLRASHALLLAVPYMNCISTMQSRVSFTLYPSSLNLIRTYQVKPRTTLKKSCYSIRILQRDQYSI